MGLTPKLYVLVGVPGSGKTTWATGQKWFNDCAYISTDVYVEEYAKSVGSTYSEVFHSYMPRAVERMVEDVIKARDSGKDIIWDQTSTTVASRIRKLRMLPNYYAIALVFHIEDKQELDRRLASRPGKHIPDDVIRNMLDDFEKPSLLEGFREIWWCN